MNRYTGNSASSDVFTHTSAATPISSASSFGSDGPPKRIEDVQRGVPAELVAIVERAMARNRNTRYRTVLALAADVRAFLARRVVSAYRTGALVEMRLWVRRNRALAASLAAAALLLVLGIAGTTAYAREADRRANAEAAAKSQFDQLALVVSNENLMTVEPRLTPGWPDQLAAITAWIEDAQRLLAQRGEVTATVAALRRREDTKSGDAAATAAGFLAKSLAGLQGKLTQLEAVLPSMQKRQRWAQAIGPLTLAHPNAKHSWAEARAAIENADGVVASALYRDQDIPLRNEDVWGLVPIGMNGESKLWEFYDLRSAWDGVQDPAALPIPAYGPDGHLTITGDTGVVFVLLPGGTLPPGTLAEEAGDQKRLTVRLDPFFLGKYEVTQGQWFRWTNRLSSDDKSEKSLALPVDQVSWLDADPVLQAQGLVLPSELQWEYGIRAGTATRWWTGDDEQGIVAKENIGGGQQASPLPVGSRSPNGFGLFDMGGNLCEWCFDDYAHYGTERVSDGRRPEPPGGSAYRCYRGGSCGYDSGFAQSGYRYVNSPTNRHHALGLRAARTSRR